MSVIRDIAWFLDRRESRRKAEAKNRALQKMSQRMYSGAKQSRLTSGWGTTVTSADAEIITSLRTLRSRCRELIRDAAFAKRAKVLVVNNIIGSGIGMQAQVRTTRKELNTRVNSDIEGAWEEWSRAENCHTGGRLHFSDVERMGMGQVFEAGEIFIRKHFRPFGNSAIPYALEVIEPELVLDEFQQGPLNQNARVRLGVETDEFHRPIAYWVRKVHPGETRLTAQETDFIERVPASQMIHLCIIDRWPQTRGVPWLHAVMRKLNDMDGYSEAEIIRSRGQAMYMATIETEDQIGELTTEGNREIALEPGVTERLSPGEKMNFHATNSPNSSADPFLRFLLRETAAGVGPSYESLSRDYSQSNYSSSRLALLDDRDLWRFFQLWFIRSFREQVHREFIQQSVLSRAIPSINVDEYANDPKKFFAVRYKPRGWSWVDPTKEVEAYKEAVKAGLTTNTDVISQTANGRDIEDILDERKQELEMMKERGLIFDTDPDVVRADLKSKEQPKPVDNSAQIKKLEDKQDKQAEASADRFRGIESIQHRNHSDVIKAINARQANFNFNPVTNISPQPVTVNTPDVKVDARSTVNTPDVKVDVQPAQVNVTTPDVKVDVQPAQVNVTTPDVKVDARSTVNTPDIKVDVQPAQVTVNTPENKTEIKNEVNVPERQVTVNTPEIKNEINVPPAKREKRPAMVMEGPDGKVIRTIREK